VTGSRITLAQLNSPMTSSGTEPTGSATEESATLRTLTPSDRQMFAKLGIPEVLLADAGVCRVTDREARENWGFNKNSATWDMSGIAFPYFAPETGNRVSVRVRRDNPEIVDGKPQNKYMTPWGDRRRLYYPPGITKEQLEDKTIPVVLVEAEKSSLALTAWAARKKRNLLVLAMGGCYGWATTRRKYNEHGVEVDEKGMLWDFCYLEGREVFILLDANVAINDNVRSAERQLAMRLRRRKATVRVLRLPVMAGVNGPDDYIAATGDEAIAAVLDAKMTKTSRLDADGFRERIELSGNNRELAEVAEDIGAAMRGTLYVHGDEIVEARGAVLRTVKPQEFRTLISHLIACIRRKDDREIIVTMSAGEAEGILVSSRFRDQLQPIERVNTVRLPVMRDNGQVVLLPEGYDEKTRTLTASVVEYSVDLGFDEALKLLRDDFFAEFEFREGDQGRSLAVAVALMVGLYVAHLLPAKTLRPCCLLTKNAEGAGATTMAQLIVAPALGNVPLTDCPRRDEEMEKLLLSVVCEARLALIFDNVKGRLSSQPLERFLTAPQIGGRLLRKNETISSPNLTTVFVTGNGMSVSSDMDRRSLVIELHQSFERPGEHIYRRSLNAATLEQRRPELLAALWALVRHWAELDSATKNNLPTKSNSAFPEWAVIVGAIVEAAGFVCPFTRSTSENSAVLDEDGEDMRDLVENMQFGQEYTFQQIVTKCRDLELFPTLTADDPMTSAKRTSFGRLLAKYADRDVGKRKFLITGNKNSRKSRRYAAKA
jgi:hypothetical protein